MNGHFLTRTPQDGNYIADCSCGNFHYESCGTDESSRAATSTAHWAHLGDVA